MKIWKSLLLLALVFFAGLAVGIVGTRVVARRMVSHPERAQAMVERTFVHRLRLTPEQQLKLHAIMADTRAQLGDLRKQFQPKTTTILHNADQQIAAMLTPEQDERYERIKESTWPLLKRMGTGPSSGPGAPPPPQP